MKFGLILTALYLLSACTTGYDLKAVKYDNLFNDSNSKVWVMNRHFVNGVNIAPYSLKDKNLVIFYGSGKVYIVPVKGLTKTQPTKGSYYIDSDEKRLDITLKDKSWILKMDYVTEDSVMLRHTAKSDIDHDIQIIPFPEY